MKAAGSRASAVVHPQILRRAALHVLTRGCGQGWLLQFKYKCVSFLPPAMFWDCSCGHATLNMTSCSINCTSMLSILLFFQQEGLVCREFSTAEYSVYLMGGANAERMHVYPVYRYAAATSPLFCSTAYLAAAFKRLMAALVQTQQWPSLPPLEPSWESKGMLASTGNTGEFT